MQLKINENTYDLLTFTEQTNTFRMGYIFSMPIAYTNINDIKMAKEFDLINGDITTHFDGVEFDKYSVGADDIITYILYKEIGKRVDNLNAHMAQVDVDLEDISEAIDHLLFSNNEELLEEEEGE